MEEVIRARLETYSFRDGDRDLDNFRFVDSKDAPGVQVSDALVGLLGKLFSYITRTSPAELVADRRTLTSTQRDALTKLNKLLDRSNDATPALLQQVASLSSMRGGQFFLESR